MEDVPRALRALASAVKAHGVLGPALMSWHEHAPPKMRKELEQIARAVRIGVPPEHAVKGLRIMSRQHALQLASVLRLHRRVGGDLAKSIDRLADAMEQRITWEGEARASAAAAEASARIVAALPFVFLPIVPLSRAPLFDEVGLTLLALGGALGVVGFAWISRLVPRPAVADPAGDLAFVVATAIRGGSSPAGALEEIARAGTAGSLGRALRMSRLAASWPDALPRCGDEPLRRLGGILRTAESYGTPVAEALEVFAAGRRSELRRDFELRSRRAPVRMVLPLTLCVLPSFVLVAIVPFLRGISPGS